MTATGTTYDTTDPAVRARIVERIAGEQAQADAWRAIQAAGVGPLVAIAPAGIETCRVFIGTYLSPLADGER